MIILSYVIGVILMIMNSIFFFTFVNIIKDMKDLRGIIIIVTIMYILSLVAYILTFVAIKYSIKKGYKTKFVKLMGVIEFFYGYLVFGVIILNIKNDDYYYEHLDKYGFLPDSITYHDPKYNDTIDCDICGFTYNKNSVCCPNCGAKRRNVE